MSLSYTVKPDEEGLAEARALFKFVGGNTSRAIQIAINRVGPKAKTWISQAITARVNLKAAYVKSKIEFKPATYDHIEGRVFVHTEGLNLARYQYGAKLFIVGGIFFPDDPIRVKVKKGAGQIKNVTGKHARVPVEGKPFIFRLKNIKPGGGSLHYAIGMWRVTAGKSGGRIEKFLAPSVSQEFDDARTNELERIADRYTFELIDAMRSVLVKKYPVA